MASKKLQEAGASPAAVSTAKPKDAILEGLFGDLPVFLVSSYAYGGYSGNIVAMRGQQKVSLFEMPRVHSDWKLWQRVFSGLCSLFADLDREAVKALVSWASTTPTLSLVNTEEEKLDALTAEDYALLCLSKGRDDSYYSTKIHWTEKQLKQVQDLRKACPQLVTKEQLAAFLAFGRNHAGLEAVPYSYLLQEPVVRSLSPKRLLPLKRLATVVASTAPWGPSLAPETAFTAVVPVALPQITWNPFSIFTVGDYLMNKSLPKACGLPMDNGVFLRYLETLTVGEVVRLIEDGTVDHTLSGAAAVDQAKRVLTGKRAPSVDLQSAEEMPKALAAVMRTFQESSLKVDDGKEITALLWDYYQKPATLRAVSIYYADHKVGSLADFKDVLSRLANKGQQKWVSGNAKNADLVLDRLMDSFPLEKALELIVKVANDRQTLSLIDWINLANNWDEAYDDMPASFWISMVKGDKKILATPAKAAKTPEKA